MPRGYSSSTKMTHPAAVGAGEPAIHVVALGRDPKLFKSGPLGGEVLLISGAAGVADQGCGHGDTCPLGLPSVIASAYHFCETLVRLMAQGPAHAGRSVRGTIPLRTAILRATDQHEEAPYRGTG